MKANSATLIQTGNKITSPVHEGSGLSRHDRDPIQGPPYTPRYQSVVIYEGFQEGSQLEPLDYRETPACRTAVQEASCLKTTHTEKFFATLTTLSSETLGS